MNPAENEIQLVFENQNIQNDRAFTQQLHRSDNHDMA